MPVAIKRPPAARTRAPTCAASCSTLLNSWRRPLLAARARALCCPPPLGPRASMISPNGIRPASPCRQRICALQPSGSGRVASSTYLCIPVAVCRAKGPSPFTRLLFPSFRASSGTNCITLWVLQCARCLWRTSWNAATSKGGGRFFIKVALTVAILLMVFPAFLLLPGVPCLLWLFGIRRQTGSFCDMRHLAYCADMEARHAISLGRALVFCPWRRVYGCELFGRHARAGTKSELVRRLGQIMR